MMNSTSFFFLQNLFTWLYSVFKLNDSLQIRCYNLTNPTSLQQTDFIKVEKIIYQFEFLMGSF